MLWAVTAGAVFAVLNTLMRHLSLELHPIQTLFLRYASGLAIMMPLVLSQGIGNYRTKTLRGQLGRGVAHTTGLAFWFIALPHLPLAYTTALNFTAPIFILLGAALFLGERMRPARWLAVLGGFVGVLVIVWPKLAATDADFTYTLIMLCSAPMFAASFLIAKALTRYDKPSVIVFWQSLTVSIMAAPFGYWFWQEVSPVQWGLFVITGVLGTLGHWCLTRAYAIADISASQPVKFLDLIWASILGFLVFNDRPTASTLAGGAIIIAVTIWIAQHERRPRVPLQSPVKSPPDGESS